MKLKCAWMLYVAIIFGGVCALEITTTTTTVALANVNNGNTYRQSDLRERSVSSLPQENTLELNLPVYSDSKILGTILTTAIHNLPELTVECVKDLNKTLNGIKMRQAWAIASKLFLYKKITRNCLRGNK